HQRVEDFRRETDGLSTAHECLVREIEAEFAELVERLHGSQASLEICQDSTSNIPTSCQDTAQRPVYLQPRSPANTRYAGAGDDVMKKTLASSALCTSGLAAGALLCTAMRVPASNDRFISTERSSQSSDCTISLQPSRPFSQLVGERIVWTAAATGCGTTPVFQFGVKADDTAEPGESADLGVEATNRGFRMVRDFSPDNTFAWAPLQEGSYEIMARIKNGFDAQDFSFAVVSDAVNPRATSADAVVT